MSDQLTKEERRIYDLALKYGREGSRYEAPVGVMGGLLDTIDRLCARNEKLETVARAAESLDLLLGDAKARPDAVTYSGESVSRLLLALDVLEKS